MTNAPASDAYSKAGVNIDEANRAVRSIGDLIASTRTPRVQSELGVFAGFFAYPDETSERLLVTSMDGVGTKLKLSAQTGRWTDAVILARLMLGPRDDDTEAILKDFVRGRQGADGFFYNESAQSEAIIAIGKVPPGRFADMFCQGRIMLSLVTWYLDEGSSELEERIERFLKALDAAVVLLLCGDPHGHRQFDRHAAGAGQRPFVNGVEFLDQFVAS